jgi:predicted nucleic acid-binding protein
MSKILALLDTAALLALANRRDNLHEQAKKVRGRISRERRVVLTTEWILTEFLNAMQRPPARTLAVRVVEQLRQSQRVQILPTSTADWQKGYDLYQSRPDKAWSLVDCISINLCRWRSIREVFTSDRNFTQAGYHILLRS